MLLVRPMYMRGFKAALIKTLTLELNMKRYKGSLLLKSTESFPCSETRNRNRNIHIGT